MVVKPIIRKEKRQRQANQRKRFFNPNLMAKYIPPRNFNMVLDGVYRCIVPTDLNFPFLDRLHLKTIVYLSNEEIPDALKLFCLDSSITIQQIKSHVSEDYSLGDINESMIVDALKCVLKASNLPVMIMSEEGSNKTGIVVACVRKKQKWNLSSIFEEYRRYDGPKVRYRLLDSLI
ncbi:tyrosine phosphatase [Blastocystis sp. subtype 4]|uniref:tyrosine phosphatase n=1 Tax=Blastocystis sp. subtype 4 TaxID=944170 RepID=UPI000711FEDB|nr:tyrosine phosphatase [Blastocystis sp. subtype 4]KNB46707.1 tyrosine phosphatase [Blastocystis sp. subtype 4]|eukprot:XP_014530150.1 tyrosine phosphatase [Blastocystis sp. subtype 4]